MIQKPWSSQLELTWGCNLRCWFCGIHDIPHAAAEHKYMELALVQEYAKQLNAWKPKIRIEFGTGGEPTLNAAFFEIVEALRTGGPQFQIMCQTNTETFANDPLPWLKEFFERGGNILVLNCYRQGRYAQYKEQLQGQDVEVVDFYHDNPQHKSMYGYTSPKRQQIFLCEDLGLMTMQDVTKKTPQRWLNNQGGSTPDAALLRAGITPLTEPLHKRCTRVFREMVLSWDGNVPLCCYDWLDRLSAGKFPEQGLQEIWEGEVYELARALLYRSNREFMPCATCNYNGGFRIGILPEPTLQEKSTEDLLHRIRAIGLQQAEDRGGFLPHQAKWFSRITPEMRVYMAP